MSSVGDRGTQVKKLCPAVSDRGLYQRAQQGLAFYLGFLYFRSNRLHHVAKGSSHP